MIKTDRLTASVECVGLEEIKTALRIDFNQFDSILSTALVAARQWVENHTSTFWAKGTARITVANEPTEIEVLWGNVGDILEDASETGAAIEENNYGYATVTFDNEITDPISITVEVGTESAPQAIREAIILLTGNLYTSKMGEIGNTTAVQMLLLPYKKHLFI